MYVPRHFEMPDDLLAAILAAGAAGELITATADGLIATHLPYLHQPGPGHGSLVLHVARNNRQWTTPTVGEALFVITPASDYISSLWYPSAQVDGKLVPTWDYATVHLYGRLIVHDDLEWTRQAVSLLMGRYEQTIGPDDMPERYLAGQLRAIVGLELVIDRIEAKAKLSQNRSVADVKGVIEGLTDAGAAGTADLVASYALPVAEAKAELLAGLVRAPRGAQLD